jgi:hypothetical protein
MSTRLTASELVNEYNMSYGMALYGSSSPGDSQRRKAIQDELKARKIAVQYDDRAKMLLNPLGKSKPKLRATPLWQVARNAVINKHSGYWRPEVLREGDWKTIAKAVSASVKRRAKRKQSNNAKP